MAITLEAQMREIFGKKVKRLREQDIIPAEVYGNADNVSVQIDRRILRKTLKEAGNTQVITLTVGQEKSIPVMARNIQYDSITQSVIHVDFYAVDMKSTVTVSVPVEVIGKSPLIDTEGGVLTTGINTLEIEALPDNIPESVQVDVSILTSFADSILVGDLNLGDGIIIHSSPNSMLASVVPPRQLEEEVTEGIEGELESMVEGEEEEGEEEEEG